MATNWTTTVRHYEQLLEINPGMARQQSWTVLVTSKDPQPSLEAVAEIASQRRPFRIDRGHIGEHMDYHVDDISVDTSGQTYTFYEMGAQLSDPQLTSELSLLGDVYALYWDTHANNMLHYAQGGRTRLMLDILERRTWPLDSMSILEELLSFDMTDNPRAASMAVLDLRSGFRLTTDWLDSVHDVIIIQLHPSLDLSRS